MYVAAIGWTTRCNQQAPKGSLQLQLDTTNSICQFMELDVVFTEI